MQNEQTLHVLRGTDRWGKRFANDKYALADETKTVSGHTLHRIKALKDLSYVRIGQLGGWIETEQTCRRPGTHGSRPIRRSLVTHWFLAGQLFQAMRASQGMRERTTEP
jgi:hypothetical protein